MVAVYKGSLNLNKVVGARVDKNQTFTQVKLKPSTDLPIGQRTMKENPNTTRDGLKK